MSDFCGVRAARAGDESRLFEFLKLLHKENGLAPMNDEKVAAFLSGISARPQRVMIGIIEGKDGSIEASVGLVLCEWWYSTDQHLEEMWTFVHPEHRQSTHAKKLIEFAKWASETWGVPLLMGILTRKDLEPKMRLLQRQLPQIGALFLHGGAPTDSYNQRHLEHQA